MSAKPADILRPAIKEWLKTQPRGAQAKLAEAAKVDEGTFSAYLQGRHGLGLDSTRSVAGKIGFPLTDLFTIPVPQSDIVTSSVTAVRTNHPSTPTKGDGVHGTSGDQVGSLTRQLADRDQTIRALRVALSAHAKELKELSGKLAHLAGASRQHVHPSARRKPKAG